MALWVLPPLRFLVASLGPNCLKSTRNSVADTKVGSLRRKLQGGNMGQPTTSTLHTSYGQDLVHGEGTSLSRVGPTKGFAVMAPRPSQYYFAHTWFCPIFIWLHPCKLPWNHMEPPKKSKENHLNQTSMTLGSMNVTLGGCIFNLRILPGLRQHTTCEVVFPGGLWQRSSSHLWKVKMPYVTYEMHVYQLVYQYTHIISYNHIHI